jgi:tripartite-type tricarboxylate transporter receptor subunit TctC
VIAAASARGWRRLRQATALLLALCLQAAGAAGARPLDTEDGFFAGKRVRYIVTTEPGGGYDQYARLIAKYVPRYLAVRSVIVDNMPGAGHLLGLRYLMRAKADGLTWGTFNTGILLEQQPLPVPVSELSWLVRAASDSRVFIVRSDAPWASLEDLRRAGRLVIASSGKASTSYLEMRDLCAVLAVPCDFVHGFGGNRAGFAIARGDVDGLWGSTSSLRPLIERGTARAVFSIGPFDNPRTPVPDLAKADGSAYPRDLIARIEGTAALARLTAAPPGVPQPRLTVLRAALFATLGDAELRAEATARGLPIDPLHGDRLEAEILDFLRGDGTAAAAARPRTAAAPGAR